MADKDVLTMWTIYEHPRDYPEGYVARHWLIDGSEPRDGVARYRPDLEAARAAIPSRYGYCLPADPDDDPTVVETWI